MFDSTRIRQLQSSLNEHDYAIMGLRSSITKLQERNDYLLSLIEKQQKQLEMFMRHLGLELDYVYAHWRIVEKGGPENPDFERITATEVLNVS